MSKQTMIFLGVLVLAGLIFIKILIRNTQMTPPVYQPVVQTQSQNTGMDADIQKELDSLDAAMNKMNTQELQTDDLNF